MEALRPRITSLLGLSKLDNAEKTFELFCTLFRSDPGAVNGGTLDIWDGGFVALLSVGFRQVGLYSTPRR